MKSVTTSVFLMGILCGCQGQLYNKAVQTKNYSLYLEKYPKGKYSAAAYQQRGYAEFLNVNLEAAKKDLLLSVELQPTPEAYFLLAGVFYYQNDYEQMNKYATLCILQNFDACYYYKATYHRITDKTENGKQQYNELYKRGIEANTALANSGDAHGMKNLSFMYHNGFGVTADAQKNIEWLTKATSSGFYIAYNNLAAAYKKGQGVPQDNKKAFEYFQLAADREYDVALNELGLMYQHGTGVEQNPEKAFQLYLKAAELGFDVAQKNVANCYESGEGTNKDLTEALAWYKKSAAQNYTPAIFRVAHFYERGKGVERDADTALEWIDKGMQRDKALGLYKLSIFWFNGIALKADYQKAYDYATQAYNLGHVNAAHVLGWIYDTGKLGVYDWQKAFEYYKEFVDTGDAWGYYYVKLGEFYTFGLGGAPKDKEKAIEMFQKANNETGTAYINVLKKIGSTKSYSSNKILGDWLTVTATLDEPHVMSKIGNQWSETVKYQLTDSKHTQIWPSTSARGPKRERPVDEMNYTTYSRSYRHTKKNGKQMIWVASKRPMRSIGYMYVIGAFENGETLVKVPMALAWIPEGTKVNQE